MTLIVASVYGLLGASASFGLARGLIQPVVHLLDRGGLMGANFRGRRIPVGVGIVIPLAVLLPLLIAEWAGIGRYSVWIALLFAMGFLGLLDDAAGDADNRGFLGHARALIQGKPTTGSLKAIFGGVVALYAGVTIHGPSLLAFLAALLVALTANAVNLLDVRPGRAIKGFVFFLVLGLVGVFIFGPAFPWSRQSAIGALAVAGAAAALWEGDSRGRFMIGDSGANALGAGAGLFLASGPVLLQIAILAGLVYLHVIAERSSFSVVIEQSGALSRIDRWGRDGSE